MATGRSISLGEVTPGKEGVRRVFLNVSSLQFSKALLGPSSDLVSIPERSSTAPLKF